MGITREPGAVRVLQRLGDCGRAVVDNGIDTELLATACELPFPAVMLDTQHKGRGSLFDAVGIHAAAVQAAGAAAWEVGWAGGGVEV